MRKLNYYFFQGFLLCISCLIDVRAFLNYDIVLERTEAIIGGKDDLVDFSQLKIIRKGSNYSFNGNITYHSDLDDSCSLAVTSALSPYGNNHFIRQPFKIDQIPVCVYHNTTTYKKIIQPLLKGHSNYPIIPPEGLCPIPKGTYQINDIAVVYDNLPPYIPRGLWKVETKGFKGKKFSGGYRVLANVIGR